MSLERTISIIMCVILCALSVYFLISCAATSVIARTQPYLMTGSERYDFLGQYIMSAFEGVSCLVCAVLFVLLLIYVKRKCKKGDIK